MDANTVKLAFMGIEIWALVAVFVFFVLGFLFSWRLCGRVLMWERSSPTHSLKALRERLETGAKSARWGSGPIRAIRTISSNG